MAEALPLSTRRWVVVSMLASALPLLWQLKWAVALGIGLIAAMSAASALRVPLPGWLRNGLALLVAAALFVAFDFRPGRDAGSALLVAMLLLKLSELRDARDARRLVGFSLFAPFAAFLQDQGPFTLGLALPAAALALQAMQALTWPDRPQPWRPLGLMALLALPLAFAGFWLFPRLATPLWGLPQNAVSRPGIDDRMAPGEWGELMADDRPAFRVRFEGPAPPQQQLYWRGPVLSLFDGREWRRARIADGLPAPAVGTDAPLRYTLTMEPTDRPYVFALEAPTGLPSSVRLDGDGVPLAQTPVRTLQQFSMAAGPARPFQPELPETLARLNLQLPEGFNPRTLARAREWRAEASTPRDYINRVLGWIRAEFAYSIAAPELGRDSVDDFLFSTQLGYCEHFSAAFVILMRGAGIPARVVTGYAGATPNRFDDFYTVRQMDAHAWAEVWLPGEGWVRVDPTAAVAPGNVFETLEDRLANFDRRNFGLTPLFDAGEAIRQLWSDYVVGFDAVKQSRLLRWAGIEQASSAQIGTAFIVLAGLAIGLATVFLLRHGRRREDAVLRAWRAFEQRLRQAGIDKARHETAADFIARATAARPWEADTLQSLSRDFISLQYAASSDSPERRAAVIAALRAYRPMPKP